VLAGAASAAVFVSGIGCAYGSPYPYNEDPDADRTQDVTVGERDAGVDARRDAELDAGREAAVDAAREAGSDAAVDASASADAGAD
jgi:hypothetical protein